MCFARGRCLFIKHSKRPMWHLEPFFMFLCVLQEMEKLKEELENMNDLMEQKDTLTQKLEVGQESDGGVFFSCCFFTTSCTLIVFISPVQETELRGRVLEEQLAGAEQRLEENQEEQENFRKSLRTLLELLDGKIFELTELRDTLARLIEEAS